MDNILEFFFSKGEPDFLKKSDKILKRGSVSDRVYFINKGVVRHFVTDHDGKEKTIKLCVEKDFFYSSIISFFKNEPSYIVCEALTDVELVSWSKGMIDDLVKENKEFEAFRYNQLVNFIVEKHQKELSLTMKSAEERYNEFCESHVSLFNRIPHYIIASYLNISPEMLSRLRRSSIS